MGRLLARFHALRQRREGRVSEVEQQTDVEPEPTPAPDEPKPDDDDDDTGGSDDE